MRQIVNIYVKDFSKKAVVEKALRQDGVQLSSDVVILSREYSGLDTYVSTNYGDFILRVKGARGSLCQFEVTS